MIRNVPGRREEWYKYLTPFQVKQLVLDPAKQSEYLKGLQRDFDNLCEYDKLKEELKPYERDVITRLCDHVTGWSVPVMEEVFLNSLRLAWIDHIETKRYQFYVRGPSGKVAIVGVRIMSNGRKMLQTYADRRWDNNLLSLPRRR